MRNKKNKYIENFIKISFLIMIIFFTRKPIVKGFKYVKTSVDKLSLKTVKYKSRLYEDIVDFRDKVVYISNFDKIIEESREIQKELDNLKIKNQELEEIKKDNSELRKLLGLKSILPYKTIAAEVKLVEIGSNSDYIYITKGFNDGIKLNQAVMYKGMLAGFVSEIHSDYSKVTTLTSPDSKISILINSKDYAILRGYGDGTFRVNNYDVDLVDNKDLIFDIKTSGYSYNFPKGLDIGVYEVKDKKVYLKTKELIFKPSYDITDARFVLVISQE